MIELNDDILNKYIDGELDENIMFQVKAKLESSTRDMMKYRMLLSIHNGLGKIPADEVSPDFTSKLMLRVQRRLKSKREQNFFLVSVLSLLLLISLGIIGYLFANYLFSAEPNSSDAFTQIAEHSQDFITLIRNLFSKGNVSIIGSVFSFILLITGYFFYDSLKHSKHR